MKVEIRHLENEAEFLSVDAIYHNCFGNQSIPSETQKNWWQKYPVGILGLIINDKVEGGISFWSIKSSLFDKLKDGLISEKNIEIKDFELNEPHYYYISEIAISYQFRKMNFGGLLLGNCLSQIHQKSALNPKVLAFSYSDGGAKILEKYEFCKIKDESDTVDGMGVYLR